MRLNGGLISEGTSEWVNLRQAWKKWNASCHLEDQIDWIEFLEEHSARKKRYDNDRNKNNS